MITEEIKTFDAGDFKIIKQLRQAEYFKLLKTYSIFVLAIMVGIEKGLTMRPSKMRITGNELIVATWAFSIFFSMVIAGFIIRDYRNNILCVSKDLKNKQKNCISFSARKYQDFIYRNFLLFHPEKENIYLSISKDEYDQIVDGEELYMEQACISGEVLLLKNDARTFQEAEEFDFENR